MRIGLALPQFDFSVPGESPLRWPTVVDWAVRAEGLGFESLWVADHLFLEITRYGGRPGVHGAFDALVTLGALARVTRRARLGTLVLCAPLRPPAVLAKALATADVVSRGRLVVGIGAGWYEPEFTAAGLVMERPAARLEHLAESCQVLAGMFGGGPFSFSGGHVRVTEARCLPVPVQQPRPPIWVGGKGDRLLDVVARHADGWNTVWTWTPDAYRERLGVLEAACERVGRDPASVTRSLGLYALVGEDRADLERRFRRLCELAPAGTMAGAELDEWRQGRMVGTVEEVREQLGEWGELGIDTLVLGAGALPFSVTDPEDVAMLAEACSLIPYGPRSE
ncbi:MAG: TIGR03619 family F420-dependent LLM class oxidoreductase [Acidimicrobiales bacterium]